MSEHDTLLALGQALRLIEINGQTLSDAVRVNFYTMPKKGLGLIKAKLASLNSQDRLTDILQSVDVELVPAHANARQQETMMLGYYREGYLWTTQLDAKGLREAGEMLFGESWMADVGRLTGDTRQRVADFNSGRRRVPIRVSEIVLAALKARGEAITNFVNRDHAVDEASDGSAPTL
ncbi:hypothetical protein PY793_10020 [Acetobacter fabarum]|uniref:hypothetical protein n=1 Tax=Acetobacter fabarum TaxID=483199 RepID=UPI00312BA55B